MKCRAVKRWGSAATAFLLGMGAIEAWCQMNEQQLRQFQAQQMQGRLKESLGPAAGAAPDMGSDRPMDSALWGYGAELSDAIKSVQEQVNAYGQSGRAISAEVLEQALPRIIEEYRRQVPPNSGESDGETHTPRSANNLASSVTGTYQNPSEQTVVVTLTDAGLSMDFIAQQQQHSDTEEEIEDMETEEAIVQVKEIQGIKAQIFYDRVNQSGTLIMKANRVVVNIAGQNIPFAMLETSADEIDLRSLTQLGGS